MADDQMAPSGPPQPVPVPRLNVSTFLTLGTPYELVVLCSGFTPSSDGTGTIGLANIPVASLCMSPLAAKELIVLLQNYVSSVEPDIGPIKSEFLTARTS